MTDEQIPAIPAYISQYPAKHSPLSASHGATTAGIARNRWRARRGSQVAFANVELDWGGALDGLPLPAPGTAAEYSNPGTYKWTRTDAQGLVTC